MSSSAEGMTDGLEKKVDSLDCLILLLELARCIFLEGAGGGDLDDDSAEDFVLRFFEGEGAICTPEAVGDANGDGRAEIGYDSADI